MNWAPQKILLNPPLLYTVATPYFLLDWEKYLTALIFVAFLQSYENRLKIC